MVLHLIVKRLITWEGDCKFIKFSFLMHRIMLSKI